MSETSEPPSPPLWKVLRLEVAESTNDVASRKPGWHAVVAKRQEKGRGRYRRSWVSDEGGLWLSAVLPTPGEAAAWALLPLAAGWALREAIAGFGVQPLHLRWPNDLMVGRSKLAGILVERFTPETAVIGIGINHSNAPASRQPDLAGLAVTLSELLPQPPSLEELLASVLAHLAVAQQRLAAGNPEAFLPSLNAAWHIDRVVVSLNRAPHTLEGRFLGVDATGRLLIRDDLDIAHALLPTEAELLRER